jgi:hypothetical protein
MASVLESTASNTSRLKPLTGIKIEVTGQTAASGCETTGGEGKARNLGKGKKSPMLF